MHPLKEPAPVNPVCILIVEDESIVARHIAISLTQYGYRAVGPAASAEEALLLVEEFHPDLVLMDIHLQGAIDGIDLAEAMRDRFRLPVVFLSAYAEDSTLLRAKAANPYGYILKPFEHRDLRVTLEMALSMHRQEQLLRVRERRLNFLLSSTSAVIYTCQISGDFGLIFVSENVGSLLGYSASECIGDPSFRMNHIHPDDVQRVIAMVDSALKNGRAETEYRFRDNDGSYRWMRDQVCLGRDPAGHASELIGVMTDITEHKQMEHSLLQTTADLHALSGRLQAVREEERATIARELHDSLGQHLTGLQIGLMWIDRHLQSAKPPDLAELYDRIVGMVPVVESLTEHTQTICTALRSSVLDDLGLVAAIEWQAADTAKHSELQFQMALPSDEDFVLDREMALALFRILQEALTNVLRHARATQVEICLNDSGAEVELVIDDNGQGFVPELCVGTQALGLLGMRERAWAYGGTVEFLSEPGMGCRVRARMPAVRPQIQPDENP